MVHLDIHFHFRLPVLYVNTHKSGHPSVKIANLFEQKGSLHTCELVVGYVVVRIEVTTQVSQSS